VYKISPNIDTLFATSFYVIRLTVRGVYNTFGNSGITTNRWGLSCNHVLACLDVLSDVANEYKDEIEDSLSRDESDPESNEVSDSYSEISASESVSEEQQDGDSREILGKDGYVWSQKTKAVKRTPMRNIVKEKPGPKGNGCQADTPLKSFVIFRLRHDNRDCGMD
jgi:hypothetical protein